MSKTPRVKVRCHCGKKLSVKANTTRPFKCIQCGQYLKLPDPTATIVQVAIPAPRPRIIRTLPAPGQQPAAAPPPIGTAVPTPPPQRDLLKPIGAEESPSFPNTPSHHGYAVGGLDSGVDPTNWKIIVGGVIAYLFCGLCFFRVLPLIIQEYRLPTSDELIELRGAPYDVDLTWVNQFPRKLIGFKVAERDFVIFVDKVPDFDRLVEAVTEAEEISVTVFENESSYSHMPFWEMSVDGRTVFSRAEMVRQHKSRRGVSLVVEGSYALAFLFATLMLPFYLYRKFAHNVS